MPAIALNASNAVAPCPAVARRQPAQPRKSLARHRFLHRQPRVGFPQEADDLASVNRFFIVRPIRWADSKPKGYSELGSRQNVVRFPHLAA